MRRVLLGSAALLILHLVSGAVVAPWVARSQLPKLIASRLHRPALLGDVRFNPYTLKATLVGLDLRDRDSSPL
ncbi:MAG TPA: hypothetical protein VFY20_04900, partial [Gemmatimonadales bacterium]|nr:hypothetical protein [Gemmatimonadales bacterium]